MNRLKKLGILFFWVCSVFTINAQQVPYYNFNMTNPVVYNPAYSGASGDINAYVTRGQRYMGYGSGAINNMLSLEGKFFIPNSGFGLLVGQESIGIMSRLKARLSYAYHLKLGNDHKLSLGVSGGYLDNRIRTNKINVMQKEDPYLVGIKSYRPTYDFNFGIAYKWKGLKIGLSVPQLIGNKVKFSKENTRGYYSLARHFMGTAGYTFHFSSVPKLSLTPHALVRYIIGAPIQYDGSVRVDYKNIGWLSATYKSDYAVQFNLGFHIFKDLHVGYSYEYIFGSFKNYYTGVNHEFLLGYTFKGGTKEKEVIKRVEVEVPDSSLIDENERLKNELKEALRKKNAVKDSLLAERQKELEDKNEFREAKNHHFVEKDKSESPAGYYVVVGVYSKDKNVTKNMRRAKEVFPDSYYVTNTINSYTYVTIYYSKDDKEEAIDALEKYKDEVGKDVWILSYKVK